jgi:hypothetical protein
LKYGKLEAIALTKLPASLIEGLTLSNNATTPNTAIDIVAGRAVIIASSDDRYIAILPSAFTKQLNATWAAGTNAGGRASGVNLTANTTYHVFLIFNLSTLAVDVLFDTSTIAANAPSGWAGRMIGSVMTDGSSNILQFVQTGSQFLWQTSQIASSGAIAATAASLTVQSPLGVNAAALISIGTGSPASGTVAGILASSLLLPDVAPSATFDGSNTVFCGLFAGGTYFGQMGQVSVVTDTNSQIRIRASTGTWTTNPTIRCLGFIHPRGGDLFSGQGAIGSQLSIASNTEITQPSIFDDYLAIYNASSAKNVKVLLRNAPPFNPRNFTHVFEDFSAVSPLQGGLATFTSTGTVAITSPWQANNVGVLALTTGASATGRAAIAGANGNQFSLGNGRSYFNVLWRQVDVSNATESFVIRSGYGDIRSTREHGSV